MPCCCRVRCRSKKRNGHSSDCSLWTRQSLEQSREIYAQFRRPHVLCTYWERKRPLFLPTDDGNQGFKHIHLSARHLVHKRKLVLEFKCTHDENSHCLLIMHAHRRAPGVGGFKTYMSDNSDSGDPAKFAAFDRIRDKIPYSLVLQELRRKGIAECYYRRNLNGISDSESDSISDTSPEPLRKKSVLRGKGINSSSADADFTGPAFVLPSSQDEPEVLYSTVWYSESPEALSGRPCRQRPRSVTVIMTNWKPRWTRCLA